MMNTDKPLVSVIMPTYNRESFLRLAIDSVLNQTYPFLELHIIDDGSKDGTRSLVGSYRDERIKYLYQENRGQSAARNNGIKNARGAFICFLDSDNLWKNDKLEKQTSLMTLHPECNILYGENEIIDESGRVVGSGNPVPRYSDDVMLQLLQNNFITFNTAMIRRCCFQEMGGFNENTRAGEDYELFLKFSTRYRFLYIPDILASYRIMDNRISSDYEKVFEANRRILTDFLDTYGKSLQPATIRRVWSRYFTSRGRHKAAAGRYAQAFADYCRAIRYRPANRQSWRALLKLILLRG